ncbi:TAG-18 protein [Ditylenchus destructor]|uniref:TAG-18 protein n=1 Tax=Ditylenchus destructor TaxID=166010 RepID=A0AAD4R6N4_9BILA|nr:TAG-18 protein [Ditylenchus destructor]
MSNFPVVRANSTVSLPRARDMARGIEPVATLSRVTSVPNLASLHVGAHYAPSTLYKYRTDRDMLDDYVTDRYNSPALHWQDHRYAARRYAHTDPIPNSLGLDYPSFWTRYKFYGDYLEPSYYRKHRDAYYDRPLWDSWKPYQYDRYNVSRGIKMYKEGLISFNFLDKKWIEPWALQRKEKDWSDVYPPAARYGPRRYFYSFAG